MSIAICSSCLFTILFNEFTKLHNDKSRKRVHYLNRKEQNGDKVIWKIEIFSHIILKISVSVILAIVFIISLNTFSFYRNLCCIDFIESILSEENHTIHIIKQLCFTFICFYIFNFSHGNLKSAMKNASEIIFYLFESDNHNQEYKEANDILLKELKNDSEVYRPTTYNANLSDKKSYFSCQCFSYYVLFFDKKSLLVKKIESLVLVCFFLITLFKLLFIEKVQLIYLWSISFLVMNLFIVAAVLLLNYFPYQVLIDFHSKNHKKHSNSLLFETRDESPLIIQQNEATTSQKISL